MKLKTKNEIIEFGEWRLDNHGLWLRKDLSEPRSKWAEETTWNNAIGFLRENGAPRFFGKDVNFLIEEWYSFNTTLSSDVDKNKKTMDNFIQLFE